MARAKLLNAENPCGDDDAMPLPAFSRWIFTNNMVNLPMPYILYHDIQDLEYHLTTLVTDLDTPPPRQT